MTLDIAKVRDLELYLQTDPKAKRRFLRILVEFERDMDRGVFSFPKSVKRMGELVLLAVKNYAREYGVPEEHFPAIVVKEVARSLTRTWWEKQ